MRKSIFIILLLISFGFLFECASPKGAGSYRYYSTPSKRYDGAAGKADSYVASKSAYGGRYKRRFRIKKERRTIYDGKKSIKTSLKTVEAEKGSIKKENVKNATYEDISRFIIYTARFNIEVFDITNAKNKSKEIIKEFQGYVQRSSRNFIIFRVKSENFNEVVKQFKSLGFVTFEDINASDVTEQFFDIKARLDNAIKIRERYLRLLDRAKDVKEALIVEKELERITQMIEIYKGKLKYLASQSSYSTVTVYFLQKRERKVPRQIKRNLTGPFFWIRGLGISSILND